VKTIRRIFVIVDPTIGLHLRMQRAVERGALLARRLDAEMRLFMVCEPNDYLAEVSALGAGGVERAYAEFVARRRADLETLAGEVSAHGLRVSIELAWDRPLHEGMIRGVLRYEPDVAVKDTHHHPAIQRALLTNTDWHLIRECPVPLLLVRGDAWQKIPRVLAAVDPLHERDKPAALDRKILDVAGPCANIMGGELHVMHAYEPFSSIAALDGSDVPIPLPVDDLNEKLRARHANALHELVAERGIARNHAHLREGSARTALPAMAKSLPASMVVMGAVARSGIRRIFVGSTAERVLETLPCDVMIVKPDGFHCPIEASDATHPSANSDAA